MNIDLNRLLKLRLVVARVGEMDNARWWNTKGQLGRLGTLALSRGFPRTHYFAQARAVFAVAGHRCEEVFDVPGSVTLWRLPEALEQEFDVRWEHWLDNASDWAQFFRALEALQGSDLPKALRSLDVVQEGDIAALSKLRRLPDKPAVQLPGPFAATDGELALLALGFARGEPGTLVVPFARGNGS